MSDDEAIDTLRNDLADDWSIEVAEITGQIAAGEVSMDRLVRRRELFRLLASAGGIDERPDPAKRPRNLRAGGQRADSWVRETGTDRWSRLNVMAALDQIAVKPFAPTNLWVFDPSRLVPNWRA